MPDTAKTMLVCARRCSSTAVRNLGTKRCTGIVNARRPLCPFPTLGTCLKDERTRPHPGPLSTTRKRLSRERQKVFLLPVHVGYIYGQNLDDLVLTSLARIPLDPKTKPAPPRFASDVQPSALFVELEDAAASAAAQATATGTGTGTGTGRYPSLGGDERPRSAYCAKGGFWFSLDTRHVEDAPGLAVIKRHPGGLEPAKRRPLQSQLQVCITCASTLGVGVGR